MQDTKEYVVSPKLTHQSIAVLLTGGIAGACAYIAMTNTDGISTRRTDLSPETINMLAWVVCVAAALLCLLFLAELISTRRRPASKITLRPAGFSIPVGSAFKKHTVSASYAQITQLKLDFITPNRVLRIYTPEGTATVAELNVGAGVFEEIHAALLLRAPRNQ